jgi:hypothetical protein
MRLVVDTNVLVAGILSASGPPGWIVEALLSGEIEPALDAGIRAEYEDVLTRPELSLEPERVAAVLDVIDAFGLEAVVPPWPEPLPDREPSPGHSMRLLRSWTAPGTRPPCPRPPLCCRR